MAENKLRFASDYMEGAHESIIEKLVGTNRIYAEILSEVDVQQLECRIEQTAPFNPA